MLKLRYIKYSLGKKFVVILELIKKNTNNLNKLGTYTKLY